MENTNIWDFLSHLASILIPIFATVLGIFIERYLRKGKVKIDFFEKIIHFTKLKENNLGEEVVKNTDIYNAESGKCMVKLDIYNTSENFKIVKDINLALTTKGETLYFSLNDFYINGEKCKKSKANREFINLIRLPPKEVKRLRLKGNFVVKEKEKILKNGISISLYYKNHEGEDKKELLKFVEPNNIN